MPVAASNLPNGKVLMWSAYAKTSFGRDRGRTQTLIFDPTALTFSERRVSNTGHDMFCPGIANLADGIKSRARCSSPEPGNRALIRSRRRSAVSSRMLGSSSTRGIGYQYRPIAQQSVSPAVDVTRHPTGRLRNLVGWTCL